MRKIGTLAILLAVASSASANELFVQIPEDVKSLDPQKLDTVWENLVVGDLFEGLYTEDATGQRIEGVALSHELSEDGLVYTFQLDPAARWSDGEAVTASDFVFAYRRLFDPPTKAVNTSLLAIIQNATAVSNGEVAAAELGVVAVDDTTLEITLERPWPFFLEALTHYTAYPLPEHVVAQHDRRWSSVGNIVSNGGFVVTEWEAGKHIKANRNEQYREGDLISLDSVTYHIITDPHEALKQFEEDKLDIIHSFPLDVRKQVVKQYANEAKFAPYAGLYYLAINHNDKLMQNPLLREALSKAINRKKLAEDVLGTGEEPAYSWVPAGLPGYEKTGQIPWGRRSYAELKVDAVDAIKKIGYGIANPLNLTLTANPSHLNDLVVNTVAEMWQKVGINLIVETTPDLQTHNGVIIANRFQMARTSWKMDFHDPYNMLTILDSKNRYNFGKYTNPKFDELLAKTQEITDQDKLAKAYREAENTALADNAAIPLFFLSAHTLVNKNIKGYKENPLNIHRSRFLHKLVI